MAKLFKAKDLSGGTYSGRFISDLIAKFLIQVFDFNKVNKVYNENYDKIGIDFINSVIETLEINFEIDEKELKRIPQTGPFITVSNYPLGGIDGLILMKLMSEIRPDFKFLANLIIHNIEPIRNFSIAINEIENDRLGKPSFSGIKNAWTHLRAGNALGIFPAGEASAYNSDFNVVTDKIWKASLIKFIKKANVPVVPIYFKGMNTFFYHFLGNIHPLLQAARFRKELFNKKNKEIKIRIGNPISVQEQSEFEDYNVFGRYLRAKTYALGTTLEVKKFFSPKFIPKISKIQPIIPAVDSGLIFKEIDSAKKDHLLFSSGDFDIICAPYSIIPNVLTEIGRLREITFREVGEGTNKSLDIDEFDLYFHHLIVWDRINNKISGAYRIGKGKDIIQQYGLKGLYIHTLFKFNKYMVNVLSESLELGRSFIVKEYQRRPLSLFLLWKGILYFLLKNNEYRYIYGPVSISNEFSKLSKSLIVDFFETWYYNEELARNVKPRRKFKIKLDYNIDNKILLKEIGNDIVKLDKYIQEIEPKFRIPVLLKKYLSLNGKIIGFNVDPKFNDCLDGLMFVDIFDIPIKTIKSFSKEINDDSILERFKFND